MTGSIVQIHYIIMEILNPKIRNQRRRFNNGMFKDSAPKVKLNVEITKIGISLISFPLSCFPWVCKIAKVFCTEKVFLHVEDFIEELVCGTISISGLYLDLSTQHKVYDHCIYIIMQNILL